MERLSESERSELWDLGAAAVPMIESAAPEGDSAQCCTVGVTKRMCLSIGVWRGD